MKSLLISHTDLDGISPIILLNLTGIKFEYKNYDIQEITESFNELFETDLTQYENIYITDLSLTEKIYEKIIEKNLTNVKVFDHHETHLFANKYDFVNVSINIDNRQTCATEMFYLYLKELYPILNNNIIKEYVNHVRELDTYNFTSELPKQIENIRSTIGSSEFIKSITKRLKKDKEHFELTTFEKRYVKLKRDELDRYLKLKESKMFTYKINNKKCGIVFSESNKSELGNYLSAKHPELDLIILIDASSRIAYRTTRDDVAVNEFASIYGGGGHRKASGSNFSDEYRINIIKDYFKEIEKLDSNI